MTAIRPVSFATPLPGVLPLSARQPSWTAQDTFAPAGPHPVRSAAADPADPVPYLHTAAPGDTLASLGELFDVYPQVLSAMNDVEDGVHPGQQIEIPGWKRYVVQRGDTLLGILKRDTDGDVPMARVAKANRLGNPDDLSVGQVLAIPCTGLRNSRAVGDAVAAQLEMGAFVSAEGAAGTVYLQYERGEVPYNATAGCVNTVTTLDADGLEAKIPGRVVDRVMREYMGKFYRSQTMPSGLTRYQFEYGAVNYNPRTRRAE